MYSFILYVSVEEELYNKLVDRRSLARPAKNPWETITVKVGFGVKEITELVRYHFCVNFS